MIEDLWTQEDADLEQWRVAPLVELVVHLLERYHLVARLEMARLETLTEEAVLLEGAGRGEWLTLRDELARFCRELRGHMALEEQRLFPAILELDRAYPQEVPEILPPLRRLLEDEHGAEIRLLRLLRHLAGNCVPDDRLCSVQARLQRSFHALERSLHRHIFLESQILFQRIP